MKHLGYVELLKSPEWTLKRLQIIERDELTCSSCKNIKYRSNFKKATISSACVKSRVPFIIDFENYYFENKFQIFLNDKYNNVHDLTLYSKHINNNLLANLEVPGIDLIAYYDLVNEKPIVYGILSQDNKWLYIRDIHVHHTYYQEGKKPWEYPDQALTTLCWNCHEELHKKIEVPVLDEDGNKISEMTPCYRCYGARHFPWYNHIESGVCFRCNGAGYEELMQKTF